MLLFLTDALLLFIAASLSHEARRRSIARSTRERRVVLPCVLSTAYARVDLRTKLQPFDRWHFELRSACSPAPISKVTRVEPTLGLHAASLLIDESSVSESPLLMPSII